MNWLKRYIINSAFEIATDKAKDYATVANLTRLASDGTSRLLEALKVGDLTEEKRAKICAAVKNIALIAQALADALTDGRDDDDEMAEILLRLTTALSVAPITDAMLAGLIEDGSAELKARVVR